MLGGMGGMGGMGGPPRGMLSAPKAVYAAPEADDDDAETPKRTMPRAGAMGGGFLAELNKKVAK